MKPIILFLILLTPQISNSQASYNAEEFQAALLEAKYGAKLVYIGTTHSFTLDIVSNNIKPTDQENLIKVDEVLFHPELVPFKQKIDYDSLSKEKEVATLANYLRYELKSFADEFNVDTSTVRTEWKELDNKIFVVVAKI